MQDMQDLCKNLAQILHAKHARFADSTARACKILAEILLRARKMSVFLHISCKILQESCNPLLQDLASNFQTCKKPCTVDFLQENVQDLCKILIQERTLRVALYVCISIRTDTLPLSVRQSDNKDDHCFSASLHLGVLQWICDQSKRKRTTVFHTL